MYYLCMEFLVGRSLKNHLYNLGLTDVFREALQEISVDLEELYEQEPDAGLGNGGLGDWPPVIWTHWRHLAMRRQVSRFVLNMVCFDRN